MISQRQWYFSACLQEVGTVCAVVASRTSNRPVWCLWAVRKIAFFHLICRLQHIIYFDLCAFLSISNVATISYCDKQKDYEIKENPPKIDGWASFISGWALAHPCPPIKTPLVQDALQNTVHTRPMPLGTQSFFMPVGGQSPGVPSSVNFVD